MSQPIEKYSTLKPMPGQGLRVMKSKLLTGLGATGVLRPYLQNTERLIERKILLQNTFNPSGGGGGGGGACANAVVSNWASRVGVNGGSVSAGTQNAVCVMYNGLVTDGLDTLMYMLNPIARDNIIATRTPLVVGGGTDPWTDIGGTPLVNADVGPSGVHFVDGNNHRWNTGFSGSASVVSGDDFGFSIYWGGAALSAPNQTGYFGTDGLVAYTALALHGGVGAVLYSHDPETFRAGNGYTPSNVVGAYQFASFNRKPDFNHCSVFFLNRTTGMTAVTGIADTFNFVTIPAAQLYFGSINNLGTNNNECYYLFLALHKALTQTQAQSLFNRVDTMVQDPNFGGG